MSKLRTLKDVDEGSTYDKGNGIVSVEIINKEATKWYKHLKMTEEDNVFDFLETFFSINDDKLAGDLNDN